MNSENVQLNINIRAAFIRLRGEAFPPIREAAETCLAERYSGGSCTDPLMRFAGQLGIEEQPQEVDRIVAEIKRRATEISA